MSVGVTKAIIIFFALVCINSKSCMTSFVIINLPKASLISGSLEIMALFAGLLDFYLSKSPTKIVNYVTLLVQTEVSW